MAGWDDLYSAAAPAVADPVQDDAWGNLYKAAGTAAPPVPTGFTRTPRVKPEWNPGGGDTYLSGATAAPLNQSQASLDNAAYLDSLKAEPGYAASLPARAGVALAKGVGNMGLTAASEVLAPEREKPSQSEIDNLQERVRRAKSQGESQDWIDANQAHLDQLKDKLATWQTKYGDNEFPEQGNAQGFLKDVRSRFNQAANDTTAYLAQNDGKIPGGALVANASTMIGELAGANVLPGGAMAYMIGNGMSQSLADSDEKNISGPAKYTTAAVGGAIDAASFYLGGKYLGAALPKLMGVGGEEGGWLADKAVAWAADAFPARPALQKLASATADTGGNVIMGVGMEAAHYLNDVAAGKVKYDTQAFEDRLTNAAKLYGVVGGISAGLHAAIHEMADTHSDQQAALPHAANGINDAQELAKTDSGLQLISKIAPPPSPADGMVRVYHGGVEQDGAKWFSPDPKYAADYARKNGQTGSKLWYLDLPEDSSLLTKAFDDTGSDAKAPYNAFEAPAEIAKNAKPYNQNDEPPSRREMKDITGKQGNETYRKAFHDEIQDINQQLSESADQPPAEQQQYTMAEADRAAIQDKVAKLRDANTLPNETLDDLDWLASSRPDLVQGVLDESATRRQTHNELQGQLRNEWDASIAIGDEQQVGGSGVAAAARAARARKISATGGDETNIPGYDQYVEDIQNNHPHLAVAASKLGGDVQSGLVDLLAGGKQQFQDAGEHHFLPAVVDEAMRPFRQPEGASDGANAGASRQSDAGNTQGPVSEVPAPVVSGVGGTGEDAGGGAADVQQPETPAPPEEVAPPESPAEPAAPIEGRPEGATSARQAWVGEDRTARGLDTINSPDRRSWQTALETSREQGIPDRALGIASEVIANPRALSDVETAGLVERAATLKNIFSQLDDEISKTDDPAELKLKAAELDRTQAEFDQLTQAIHASGTEKGRALAAQKLTLNRDLDLISVLSRAKAVKGNALTGVEREEMAQTVRALEAANKRLAEFEENEKNKLAEKAVNSNGRRLRRRATKVDQDREINGLMDNLDRLLRAGCHDA